MKDVDTAHLGTMSMTWSELQKRLRETDLVRPDIKIKVCAVWDTVGSLGMPIAKSFLSKLSLNVIDDNPNPYSFVNTEVCDNIEHAFHAIALDEHRVHFEPTIWEQPDLNKWPRTLKQCWFTGYHTHIGGGNDTNNMLPNIALAWMMTQIKDFLAIDHSIIKADPRYAELANELHLEGEANPDSGKLKQSVYLDVTFTFLLGEIKDSKAGWFTFDGFGDQGARTPSQYARTDPKTMKPKVPKELMVNTNETIHSSVRRRFWGKDLLHQHPYMSEALRAWEPRANPPSWGSKQNIGLKDIPEEEMTEYELDIYRSWFPGFRSIEDFDLQRAQQATH